MRPEDLDHAESAILKLLGTKTTEEERRALLHLWREAQLMKAETGETRCPLHTH